MREVRIIELPTVTGSGKFRDGQVASTKQRTGKQVDFNKDSLKIDAKAVADHLCTSILEQIRGPLKKSGAVIGISGGIDSSVVAALCARALSPKKVIGIMMPETDSASESADLAGVLAAKFGFETVMENISEALAGSSPLLP